MKTLHRTAVKAALALSVGSVLLGAPQAKAEFIPPNQFNPSSSSTIPAIGGFAGIAPGPFSYNQVRVIFDLSSGWTAGTLTGISITGDGIAGSLPFSNLSFTGPGTFFTDFAPIAPPITSINFATSTLSFTIPAGVASNGNTITARISYNDTAAFQTNTSSAVLLTAASSVPVPGPLPLLGVAAAFGFSRKLRKRIKQAA
jgi:hypothetical protein